MEGKQRLLGLTPGRIVGLGLGLAILVAIMVRTGAGPVAHSLESLRFAGLLLLVLLHLPVVAAMGWAWHRVAGDIGVASRMRFVWARLVRDAAAEALPFSQLGGFVLGLHALHVRGIEAARGALSMGVDLVIELAAKLPYLLGGVLVLCAVAPESRLLRPLLLGLALTSVAVAVPLAGRRRVWRAFESAARAILRRWKAVALLDPSVSSGELEAILGTLLSRRSRVLAGLLVHLACWIIGAAELWVVFALLGERISAAQAVAIDSAVMGLRTFAFMIPAAAGVQEASYVLAGAVFGVPPTAAVAASLARRARDLVLGAATLALYAVSRALSASRRRMPCASPAPQPPATRSGCNTAR